MQPSIVLLLSCATLALASDPPRSSSQIGVEKAVHRHLEDDEEFRISLADLIAHGRLLFAANWTVQEGAGRPLGKGNGRNLADPSDPLVGSRSFNRLSGPDANSCAGCHNAPFGITGGSGDFVTSVFTLGQRFDFLTFDPDDNLPTRGSRDEAGKSLTMQNFADLRVTTGLFGAGYIEMLARQITAELESIRDSIQLGETRELCAKGISFGKLTRQKDGLWDVTLVQGLPRQALTTTTSLDPPMLVVRPWHQSASVVSLREFSNNAFNQHHGIQTVERFGIGTDPDGDGIKNEMTRADVTAVTVFQATLAVPGRVIPRDPDIEDAVWKGEKRFEAIGCATCHIPKLPLDKRGWIYEEPNPYNPATNLRSGDAETLRLDLNSSILPKPRLTVSKEGVVWVPAYTDLKLHDITSGPGDWSAEPLDMNVGNWAVNFGKGNAKFLTRRLWGCANQPPYFHHGLFTTMREAVLAHSGEALESRRKFEGLSARERDEIIEFLKTLQVLPPGVSSLIVDEQMRPREWPPQTRAH